MPDTNQTQIAALADALPAPTASCSELENLIEIAAHRVLEAAYLYLADSGITDDIQALLPEIDDERASYELAEKLVWERMTATLTEPTKD